MNAYISTRLNSTFDLAQVKEISLSGGVCNGTRALAKLLQLLVQLLVAQSKESCWDGRVWVRVVLTVSGPVLLCGGRTTVSL